MFSILITHFGYFKAFLLAYQASFTLKMTIKLI